MTEPVNNLQTKFDALQTLLVTQHTELMEQLSIMNGNMQSLVDAVSGVRGVEEGNTISAVTAAISSLQLAAPEIDLSGIISRLDTAQQQRGSQVSLQTDIRNAIGTIVQYPENYTVKRLLALLNTALNGELAPTPAEPADELAPTPTFECGESGFLRATGFVQGRAFAHQGESLVEWFPLFPGYTDLYLPTRAGLSGGPYYNQQLQPSDEYGAISIDWNYNNNTNKPLYAGKLWTYDTPPNSNQQIIPNLPPLPIVAGGFKDTLRQIEGTNAGRYQMVAFALYFPPGVTPVLNVWACYDTLAF